MEACGTGLVEELPGAAEGFDEEDGGLEALAEELGGGALVGEEGALGVEDVEKVYGALVVGALAELQGADGGGGGVLLGVGLIGEGAEVRKGGLDVLEGYEDLLAVNIDLLAVTGLGDVEVGEVAAALEDGEGDAGADLPDAALPVEEIAHIGALEACGAGEADDGEEGGDGDADAGIGGGEVALGGGDIGAALEEGAGEAGGDIGHAGIDKGATCELEAAGGEAEEGSEGVFHLEAGTADAEEIGLIAGEIGGGAGDIEVAGEAGVEALLGDAQGIAAGGDGALEDG